MPTEEEFNKAFALKRDHACTVLREEDFYRLGTNEPGGAPATEYDFEALVMAGAIPSNSTVERAAQIVAYVFTTSFGSDVEAAECLSIATHLLEGWGEDYMTECADFDPMHIVDGCFERYLARVERMNRNAPEITSSDGKKLKPSYSCHAVIRIAAQCGGGA